jgi:hypothetical protein
MTYSVVTEESGSNITSKQVCEALSDEVSTVMAEFVYPSYGEWLDQLNRIPWKDQRPDWHRRATLVFRHVSPLFREQLELSSRRDYYQPERAALVLESILPQPATIRHGSVAYAAWMLNLTDIHWVRTTLVGAEICRGIVLLSDHMEIPHAARKYLKSVLQSRGQDGLPAVAGDLVLSWLSQAAERPFATWLRSQTASQHL